MINAGMKVAAVMSTCFVFTHVLIMSLYCHKGRHHFLSLYIYSNWCGGVISTGVTVVVCRGVVMAPLGLTLYIIMMEEVVVIFVHNEVVCLVDGARY